MKLNVVPLFSVLNKFLLSIKKKKLLQKALRKRGIPWDVIRYRYIQYCLSNLKYGESIASFCFVPF